MRLTVDVILRAPVSVNPLKERELNLRGLQAPAIENLGVTKDGFDCIDLSDNEIKKLENFPRLRRLRMLLLHNNHISKIQDSLAESIENLEVLMLTGNRVGQLAEVERLVVFKKLDTLSLIGNPVAKRQFYRQYVIHKLPQLRVLDFQRIRPREREAAAVFFNSVAGKRVEAEARGETIDAPAAVPPPPPPRPQPALRTATPHATGSIAPPAAPKPMSPVKTETPKLSVPPPPPPTRSVDVVMQPAGSPKKPAAPVVAEPSTPPKASAKADVDMQEVPYTPSKPIEQLTVNQLREALKQRGLQTKGLKAELVKRLKDAVGA
ncbi:hypothetical protein P43SY_006822 [Pythium insidiosum]|uniref:SAP domain-containing protein n=1 Tax=Pythium insidiosum TaxID=114742 RepID=A0AAD5M4E9_PYTIN|nr:hypothetical protein P43SY_006822 [Pythium insidiosum]